MLAAGGSRISHQLRECHQHHYRRRHNHRRGVVGLAFGFCNSSSSTRILQLSTSFLLKPQLGDNYNRNRCGYHHGLQHRRTVMSTSSLQSKSSGEIPSLSDCFSQPEDVCDLPSDGLSSVAGGIVALGKFDALHIGHRELAIQASRVGVPYLLSFVGMAEVLGWEPRAPIVAKCDRRRILSSWAPYCGNIVPAEFQVEFSSVRHLTPRQFVEKLSTELGVSGVVAGRNYRFGYKAAGDTSELVKLCKEYGVGAYIINSVMDKNQDPRNIAVSDSKERGQVSSTRVRHALAVGDMKYVSELLGRPHRLKLVMKDQKEVTGSNNRWRISAPKSCLLNLAPKESFYENCTVFLGNQSPVAGRVLIDATDIHIELDETSLGSCIHSTDSQRLSIEFGD